MSPRTSAFALLLLVPMASAVGCMPVPVDDGPASCGTGGGSAATTGSGSSDEDNEQSLYARAVLEQIHVLQEIRGGRAEALADGIDEMLPAYLAQIASNPESEDRTAALTVAKAYYQRIGQAPPAGVAGVLAGLPHKLSDHCYKLATSCRQPGEKGCYKWPTSLQPVDVSSPDPYGWRYIEESHCGFHYPKFWKMDCGRPLTGELCNGESGEGGGPGTEPDPGAETWTCASGNACCACVGQACGSVVAACNGTTCDESSLAACLDAGTAADACFTDADASVGTCAFASCQADCGL